MTMCTEYVPIAKLHSRMVEMNTGEDHVTIIAVLPYSYTAEWSSMQLKEVLVVYLKPNEE